MGMFNLTPKKIELIKQSAKGTIPGFLAAQTIGRGVKRAVNSIKRTVNTPTSVNKRNSEYNTRMKTMQDTNEFNKMYNKKMKK